MTNGSNITELVRAIMDYALDGLPPLSSATELAQEYLSDRSFPTDEHRVQSLIRWETSKNFTTGFLTGFGGLLTLPVNVSAALGASWVVQARMVGAVCTIHGYDIHQDRVRTLVFLSLVGDAGKEVLKEFGIQFGKRFTARAFEGISGRLLIEINKKIGFRLITKAGQRGLINLTRGIPVAGGLIGGAVDAAMCRVVGRTAIHLFPPQSLQ